MELVDSLYVYGHKNLLCTHKSTIEVTKEKHLTKRGNCILGIKSTKACKDLSLKLKHFILNERQIYIVLKVGTLSDCFYGFGHKELTLSDAKEMVFRTSNYICDRTVLINCSKSSDKINRKIIKKLKNNKEKMKILFFIDKDYAKSR